MFTPSYFPEFSCRAAGCGDPCCAAGWQIPLDDAAYSFYLGAVPDIAEKTELADDGSRVFKTLPDRKCGYFRSDGLCDIYIKTGGKLCEICSKYPRFFEEYDGFTEAGLSLSCPTAAELVLSQKSDCYAELSRETPDPLLQVLANARRRASQMIFAEPNPDDAAGKLLGIGADLQGLIDVGEPERAAELEFSPMELLDGAEMAEARRLILSETEILSEKWEHALSAKPVRAGTALERRNYLQYLNYRYFLKSINTEDVFTECSLICFLYRLASELCEPFAAGVRLISREIEHNDGNLKVLRAMLRVG